MGTEKFIAFKEDGTAYRLKGRILRFLDNEPVSEADKTNIRSTLSVPASAEGLTPANNLSDLDNAATARTNLSVNSVDEDAEATGTKLVGPALYFDGVNDYLEVADDAKFSFTDGTDDLPFSVSGWVNMGSLTNFTVASKYQTGQLEWMFFHTAANGWTIRTQSGATYCQVSTGISESNTDEWVHVCATYGGAGPNSTNAFSSAMDAGNAEVYVNGIAKSLTRSNDVGGAYTGMTDGTAAVRIGQFNNAGASYTKGHIKDVKIFNRELTATEVAQLARGADLGYADEYGGALGGVGTIDETVGVSSWTGAGSVVSNNLTETANTTVGARANVLKQEATANSTGETRFYITQCGEKGKRIRIEFDYYIPSTNTTIDGINLVYTGGSSIATLTATDTWTRAAIETTVFSGSDTLQFRLIDGGANNATAGDYVGIDNFRITEIGTLADFRSERFDSSTGKWYDLANGFIGTNSGATLVGREVPVYETGTWTPTLTFGGASASMTYGAQEGYYTRIGDTVFVTAYFALTAKGVSTGSAQIAGLPFTARNTATNTSSICFGGAANLAGLTSPVSGVVTENATTIDLYDWGATGVASLTEANFTDTTFVRFSGTYQIQ